MKLCRKCGEFKDPSCFGVRKASNDGLAYKCNSCRNAYRKLTKNHISEYNKKYFSQPDKLEKRREYNRSYYSSNKDYFREWNKSYFLIEDNREKRRIRQKLWVSNNRNWICHYNGIRRDLISLLDIDYTYEDSLFTRELFKGQCFNCSSTTDIAIDHHNPLSNGFGLSRANAVLLCKSCNSKKKDKIPSEFYSKEQLLILESLGIKEEPIRM